MMFTRASFLFGFGMAMVWLGGCAASGRDGGGDLETQLQRAPLEQLALQSFDDCDAYRARVLDGWAASLLHPARGLHLVDAVAAEPVAVDGASPENGAVPDNVSQTNVQEAGVDEADVVKAGRDGHLYVLSGRYFVVADAFPPEQMRELARIDLGPDVRDLFLDEDRGLAVVLAQSYGEQGPPDIGVTYIDVTNPAAPAVLGQDLIEGWLIDQRKIDGRVLLVGRFVPPRPDTLYRDDELQALIAAFRYRRENDNAPSSSPREELGARLRKLDVQTLREQVRARVAELSREVPDAELVPTLRRDGATTATPLLPCSQIHAPGVDVDPGLLNIIRLDLDRDEVAATAVVNNAWMTYASRESLYVVQTSRGWWWNANQRTQSAIYKFDVGSAQPAYRGVGRVDGWVLNRFSMSEHDGYLRVATTSRDASGETAANLFVLDDPGAGTLTQAGSVTGLAPGETIQSARFLADRGFLVTFRQVDPLFAFDLSNPEAPRLAGELKIPGFSTYIHPLGQDHLLTIGVDGDETQADVGSVAVQLFDVSDLAHPRLTHKAVVTEKLQYGFSLAQHDPHAFTFFPPRNLLAFPLTTYDTQGRDGFSGAVVYKVDPQAGLSAVGRVDHAELAEAEVCATDRSPEADLACGDGRFLWAAAPRRSVVMTAGAQAFLYSLSHLGIKATPVTDANQTLSVLPLPPPRHAWWF